MQRPRSFAEFWPVYVRQHISPVTRKWHFVGLTAAFAVAIATAPLGFWWWLLLAPTLGTLVGYGASFYGHYLAVDSHPTLGRHPWWSGRAAIYMYVLMCRGRMTAEVERLSRTAAAE
jgi:hypothetical protein